MNNTLGGYVKLDGTNLDAAYAEAWGAIGTGAVASEDGRLVTGKTVFAATNALSDRIGTIASDGNYISASGSVSENLISLDNQLKANAGAIQGIERTGNATDGFTTTIEGKLSVSNNGAFSISGDKFTVGSDGAISAANGKFSVNSSGVLSVGSATQNTSVSETGLTIKDGPSVTTSGIDAGGKKITGVAIAERDTEAVNYRQLIDVVSSMSVTGGNFITGQGLTTETISENDKSVVVFKVKAGEGLGFDSYGALKVNAGDGLTIDTDNGNVLKVNKGTIADDNAGFVTGGDVYSALAVKADAATTLAGYGITDAYTTTAADEKFAPLTGAALTNATLTNTTISTGSIADAVMLGTGDNAVSVGSLKSSVATNTSDITELNTTVSGHTTSIGALNETLNNATDGLVKKVADNTKAIGDNAGYISDLQDVVGTLQAKTQNITLNEGTTTISGALSAGATTVSGLTVGDRNVTEALTTTGSVAEDNKGFVSGGKVFAVTDALDTRLGTAEDSLTTAEENITALQATVGNENGGLVKDVSALATTIGDKNNGLVKTVGDNTAAIGTINTSITGINDSITSLSSGKANVDLDNISDTGKAAVRGLISVAQGNNVTITKSTSDAGVDTYTISAADGITYSAGDGVAISDTNEIRVTANGVVEENNTGIVTGGMVYSALQAFKPDGEIESGNEKAVSGATVFAEVRPTADGSYVKKASTTGENLSALDTAVKTNADRTRNITATEEATTIAGKLNAGATTVTSLTDGTATLSGGALIGVTTITASGAISGGTLNVGGMATVTGLTVGETNVTTALTTTGEVAENNAGFVTGGTVFSAMQAYQPNGVIEEGNTKAVSGGTVYKVTSDLDARIKANADAIATKADASTVETLGTKVETNAKAIEANTKNITANTEAIASNKSAIETNTKNITANTEAIASNKSAIETNTKNIAANTEAIEKNASDITTLGTKVTANETALAQKADKANTLKGYGIEDAYTKEDTDTLLNKKADKTELDAVKVVVGDTNSGLVKDVNDLKNASQKITTDDQGNTKVDGTLVVGNTEGEATLVVEKDKVVVKGNDVTTQLSTDGKVENNNHGYVDGDKVYDYLNGKPNENETLKLGENTTKVAIGNGSSAGTDSVSIGKDSSAGTDSVSIGEGNSTNGTEQSTAIGYKNTVSDDQSVALGDSNTVSGTQSIAIGHGHMVTGDHSGAFGDPATISGDYAFSVGNNNNISGSNSIAVGNDNIIGGNNTFVLGSNVKTNASNAVVLGDGSVGVDNAVSVGAPGNERQIKNVAPGTEATDVATMGQVYTVAQNINKVDNRLNKVGAGAAALAALHPIDTDDKFTMGLGYGNYRSAHAMAMGMFYRPTEKIMISVGGALGNGENMVNAGISFALDKGKGFGTSKAVMAKNIKALSAENAAIKEENAGMKKQLDVQGQEIAALKAALARLEAKIGK